MPWWPFGRAERGLRPRVVLYTRAGCHLCHEVEALLGAERRRIAFDLEVVDVDGDPGLVRLYDHEVPVIEIDGRARFRGKPSCILLRRELRAAGREAAP